MTTILNRNQAAEYLGVRPLHMGTLFKNGKIPNAKKVPMVDKPKTLRWETTTEDLDVYKSTRKGGVGKRADGRNKWTTYLNLEELAILTQVIQKTPGLEEVPPITRANPPKAKQS